MPEESIAETVPIQDTLINGRVWALVVGVIAWLWFGQLGIALILGVAMLINLCGSLRTGYTAHCEPFGP